MSLLLWSLCVPLLPSSLASSLAFLCLKWKKKFLYYNLCVASILTSATSFFIVNSLFYGTGRKDAQDGLVLLFFPIWMPIFCIGFFLFGLLVYLFIDFEKTFNASTEKKQLSFYPLLASIAVMLCYVALWIYIAKQEMNIL